MAFHSYPHVIRKLFNAYRFGPPESVTSPSACTRVDHSVSRLPPRTITALFGLAFASAPCLKHLASPVTETRRFIMQKARRRCIYTAPTACRHMISGSVSLPCSGFFSPFPHGTGSLSVSREYLALRDGPRGFDRNSSCSGLLRCRLKFFTASHTGLSPSSVLLSSKFRSLCQSRYWRSYNP